MKLLSCHIENFGRLHDFSMEFAEGVNVVCQENGWGKSTFAAFVRAMFYGLEGERKRSIEENERKRYSPWQGGVFGGQLTFEIKKKRYTVSRIFREKESLDEFEIRDADTNLVTADYTRRLGEEIFHIDRESFLRTVFIGQNECETSPTDDINAKISRLTDNTNDMNSYEDAYARLTEILNRLNPSRATGSIAKRSNQITTLERVVQDGASIAGSMDRYQEYLKAETEVYQECKEQIQRVGEERAKASIQQALLAKKAEWERLKRTAGLRRTAAQAAREKFPAEIPPETAVRQEMAVCGSMELAADRMSLYAMDDSERKELESLKTVFVQGIFAEEEIEEMLKIDRRLQTLRQEFSAEQMTVEEESRFQELDQAFSGDREPVSSYVVKWNNRNTKQSALASKHAAQAALKAAIPPPKRKRSLPILAVIGFLLAVAGAAMTAIGLLAPDILTRGGSLPEGKAGLSGLFSGFMTAGLKETGGGFAILTAGVIVLVLGFLLLITGIANGRRKKEPIVPEITPELEELQEEIEADYDYIENVDCQIAEYLSAHGREFDEYTVTAQLQAITEEAVEYVNLKKKARRAADSTIEMEIEDGEKLLSAFLQTYGMTSPTQGFAEALHALKDNAVRYAALREKEGRYAESQSAKLSAQQEICSFLHQYGFTPSDSLRSQLGSIRDDIVAYQDAWKLFKEASGDLEAFEYKTDTAELDVVTAEETLPSLADLDRSRAAFTEKMENSHKAMVEYRKALEELQERYEEWEESKLRLQEERELQQKEQAQYRHVSEARRYLELAKTAITERYAAPILTGFRKYYAMIANESPENFYIDANTVVTVKELGKQRETNTLSTGFRDLVGICLRIALVDAMYEEETPVLIMDDPFTNLDDRKLAAGKEFLKKAAERYQVLYFTCSEERAYGTTILRGA